jgi:opacity protein-like surface antigen
MRGMKRLLLATVLCGLFSLPSYAQANSFRKFEIDWNLLSFERVGGTNFAGGSLGFTYHATEHWGIVAESAYHANFDLLADQSVTTYTFGPRYSVRRGNRLTLFTEGRVGAAYVSARTLFGGSPTTDISGFTFAGSGGMNIGIRPWIGWRAIQADYTFLHLGSTNKSGIRLGTGLVFRFGK